ncbi:MAG: hypothetical protein HKN59_02740 [Gammaproteobacteria bacterium]|nr:hypothetical protein [Gammaproteobacteria bacterium]
MTSRKYLASLLVLALMGLFTNAIAHEGIGGHLARMWEVTPMADKSKEFNEAFKKHIEWRKENKDPWGWSVYYATTGKGINSVYVRSVGHHWADFDAYRDSEFSKKASEHWNENVDPYVKYYDSSIDETDNDLHYWPEGSNYRYFWVTSFYLKPGHGGKARQAVVAVTKELEAAGRESPNVWLWDQTGKHAPVFSIVVARDDWAGFDWPDKGVRTTLVERVGEKKADAMMADFFEHVAHQESQIYARDMDMSYEAAN